MTELDPRLHGYQVRAVEWLRSHDRSGLFLEMGLGKTASVLQAITPDHLPVLVVAPKRVVEQVWPTEAPKWRPDLSVALAHGKPAARAQALASDADIIVLSHDNIGDLLVGSRKNVLREFSTIVIDEVSKFKGRKVRWRVLKKATQSTRHVWALTGTPTPKGLLDLWAQMFLIDRGEALGSTYGAYQRRYFIPGRQMPNGVVIEWWPRPETEDRVHELISSTVLTMRAVDHMVRHQEPLVNTVEVPLSATAARVYKELKSDLTTNIGGQDFTAGDGGALYNRLAQVTAGFLYGDWDEADREPTAEVHRDKVTAALEVIEGTGSPVLVFYRFRWEREALLGAIPGIRDIDEPGAIDDWNAGQVPALLANPASASHGLNLQYGGHTILWTSLPNFDLELWQQANGRLIRQGQEHRVVIHVLMSPGTIDVVQMKRLDDKAVSQDELMEAVGYWGLV